MQGYLAAGAAVLLGVVALFGYWQYNRANDLEQDKAQLTSDLATAKGAIVELNNTIDNITNQLETQKVELTELQETNNDITERHNKAIADLDSYRDRIGDTAQGKPRLLERAANRATGRVFRDIERATGAFDSEDGRSEGDEVSPASASGSDGAGSGDSNPNTGDDSTTE